MAPTPPEEIARQHEAACLICREPPIYAESQRLEEISLEHKESSIVRQPEILLEWSSRGNVDISMLKALVEEGYELNANLSLSKEKEMSKAPDVQSASNYWNPVNASVNNVAITRPSHDNWGIGKIVLIFCDDFLKNVYEMPWYSTFSQALEPILETLQIGPDQMIRCLLANLPPGVTIPVHYDTGEWVPTTHRIHVPIIVQKPDEIFFSCGARQENMKRIACRPGHVFEINNQVWHTVSNCSEHHRVHLILDYAEKPRDRIRLRAGERLFQTRRSVDRLSSQPRPVPSFLILGAQKAGTTSLYHYITQHPLVLQARRRETHCLDWRWNDEKKTTEERIAWVHQFYYHDDLQKFASCCTGDSTPSYLLDSLRVVPRLKEVFPHQPALIVTCREPIARCWSHFQMVTSTDGTEAQLKARGREWREKTIEEVVREELQNMDACGLVPYFDMKTGSCCVKKFERFSNSPEENAAYEAYLAKHVPLNTGSHNLLVRSLYALQLSPWEKHFGKGKLLILPLESFDCSRLSSTMEAVYHHIGLPVASLDDEKVKNVRNYDSKMPEKLQDYLQDLFALHNRRLADVVQGSPHWRDVPWLTGT